MKNLNTLVVFCLTSLIIGLFSINTYASAMSSYGSTQQSKGEGWHSETVVQAQKEAATALLDESNAKSITLQNAIEEVREVVKNGEKLTEAQILKMIAEGKIMADKAKVKAKKAKDQIKEKLEKAPTEADPAKGKTDSW